MTAKMATKLIQPTTRLHKDTLEQYDLDDKLNAIENTSRNIATLQKHWLVICGKGQRATQLPLPQILHTSLYHPTPRPIHTSTKRVMGQEPHEQTKSRKSRISHFRQTLLPNSPYCTKISMEQPLKAPMNLLHKQFTRMEQHVWTQFSTPALDDGKTDTNQIQKYQNHSWGKQPKITLHIYGASWISAQANKISHHQYSFGPRTNHDGGSCHSRSSTTDTKTRNILQDRIRTPTKKQAVFRTQIRTIVYCTSKLEQQASPRRLCYKFNRKLRPRISAPQFIASGNHKHIDFAIHMEMHVQYISPYIFSFWYMTTEDWYELDINIEYMSNGI